MKYFLLSIFMVLTLFAKSQSVAGSWFGKAELMLDVETNNYLTELILKQKGSTVSGIMGYYFKNQYQSYLVNGTYNAKTRLLRINSVPLIYYRSNDAQPSVNCVMDFEATLTVSRVKSTLKGYYIRGKNYQYTCPDLNLNFTMDTKENTDSILREAVAEQRIWRPGREELVVTQEVIQEKKSVTNDPKVNQFNKRSTVVKNEFTVNSDSVRITFYDNGTVDGDTISVFYNKIPILTRQGLNTEGINVYVMLDPATEVHEISMFAENLGSVPPNSALMVVHDGIERYEVFMTSTLSSNGAVRLRKKKPVN
jgi:hypothetical protein